MFRVTHLITGLSEGGAEHTLWKLLSRIDRRRFECEVVSLREEGPLAERLRHLDIRVTHLHMRPGRLSVSGLFRLTAHLRRHPPDLLQTWLYHADLAGTVAGALAGVPRTAWNVRASNMDRAHYGLLSGLVFRACVLLSRFPEVVVTNSAAAIDHHTAQGYRPRRWTLIPNGVDTVLFRPDAAARPAVCRELGIDERARLVGCVGRSDPMKDHESFLAAARIVAARHPGARFVLVGHRLTRDDQDLVSLISRHALDGRVYLLGVREDLARLLAALDVMVSSSAFGEGFPNVIAEAMACGVPCVVTDVGDSAPLVGDSGLVVPPRDSSALAGAIDRLLQLDSTSREKLGRAGRERIRTYFELSSMVAAYEALYETILGRERCAA